MKRHEFDVSSPAMAFSRRPPQCNNHRPCNTAFREVPSGIPWRAWFREASRAWKGKSRSATAKLQNMSSPLRKSVPNVAWLGAPQCDPAQLARQSELQGVVDKS